MTTPTPSKAELHGEAPQHISPTLQRLKPEDRPNPSPACETCPASLWFKTEADLTCFCSRMHSIVWNIEVAPIMMCDGREQALSQMRTG